MLYVLTRTHHKSEIRESHGTVVRRLATIAKDIWNKADCCPFSRNTIFSTFEKTVWRRYQNLKKEKQFPEESGVKRSHKQDPSKISIQKKPTRRSKRLCPAGEEIGEIEDDGSLNDAVVVDEGRQEYEMENNEKITQSQRTMRSTLRLKWDEKEGGKLFDIKCQNRVIECSKTGQCFDESFYQDQRTSRSLQMLLTKVTKEYLFQEQKRMRREAIQGANRKAACDEIDDDYDNVPDFENDSCAENVSDDEWDSAPATSLRGKRKASSESVNICPVPVRIMGGRRSGDSRIEPR